MFNPLTVATVKATASVLAVHGYGIIQRFYERLFEAPPVVEDLPMAPAPRMSSP